MKAWWWFFHKPQRECKQEADRPPLGPLFALDEKSGKAMFALYNVAETSGWG